MIRTLWCKPWAIKIMAPVHLLKILPKRLKNSKLILFAYYGKIQSDTIQSKIITLMFPSKYYFNYNIVIYIYITIIVIIINKILYFIIINTTSSIFPYIRKVNYFFYSRKTAKVAKHIA